MNYFLKWQDNVGSSTPKFYKTTLWQADHLMLGLNCLEPGQTQSVHAHDGADKFYFVLEGSGQFTVGDEQTDATAGSVVIAPAGIPHGVTNITSERLSILIGIAPPPK